MARYRKKPIEIEAVQLAGGNTAAVCAWIAERGGVYRTTTHPTDATQDELFIHTLEGELRAVDSDWILRGIKGELYPCRADIFAETYEEVDVPRAHHPFQALRDTGLLWLINRTTFHPRGLALALHIDDAGEALGWSLTGDGTEPIRFSDDSDSAHFARVNATLAAQQKET